jgi:ketosteroid isomerase-like protein
MCGDRLDSYGPSMSALDQNPTIDQAAAERLCERLADVFRTADVADVFTDDLFLDGHPPFWRFQLQGVDQFSAWLTAYSPNGTSMTVERTIPTATGFVAEVTGSHDEDGELMTDRKILLCAVRDGRVAELTIYCSGDWDSALRARHAAETTLLRP